MLTFEGKGQSSNNNIITEGPNGLCIGITLTIELTTCIQPSSLSAMAFNFNIAGGGSWSLNIYKHICERTLEKTLEILEETNILYLFLSEHITFFTYLSTKVSRLPSVSNTSLSIFADAGNLKEGDAESLETIHMLGSGSIVF